MLRVCVYKDPSIVISFLAELARDIYLNITVIAAGVIITVILTITFLALANCVAAGLGGLYRLNNLLELLHRGRLRAGPCYLLVKGRECLSIIGV
jgi:hypothetical protein